MPAMMPSASAWSPHCFAMSNRAILARTSAGRRCGELPRVLPSQGRLTQPRLDVCQAAQGTAAGQSTEPGREPPPFPRPRPWPRRLPPAPSRQGEPAVARGLGPVLSRPGRSPAKRGRCCSFLAAEFSRARRIRYWRLRGPLARAVETSARASSSRSSATRMLTRASKSRSRRSSASRFFSASASCCSTSRQFRLLPGEATSVFLDQEVEPNRARHSGLLPAIGDRIVTAWSSRPDSGQRGDLELAHSGFRALGRLRRLAATSPAVALRRIHCHNNLRA